MPQHPPSPNPSAPKPSTDPIPPGRELLPAARHAELIGRLEETPLSARTEPLETFTVVKFIVPAVVGGHTVNEVENKPRWPFSFTIDWQRRIVWVQRELANGQFARVWVPFENCAWGGCQVRS